MRKADVQRSSQVQRSTPENCRESRFLQKPTCTNRCSISPNWQRSRPINQSSVSSFLPAASSSPLGLLFSQPPSFRFPFLPVNRPLETKEFNSPGQHLSLLVPPNLFDFAFDVQTNNSLQGPSLICGRTVRPRKQQVNSQLSATNHVHQPPQQKRIAKQVALPPSPLLILL